MSEEVRIIAPTGTLGYGFNVDDFEFQMGEFKPHVVAVDAGSTDPGPHYLGSGTTITSATEIRNELGILIRATHKAGIPLIVGSCGGAGSEPHVEWVYEIVRQIASEAAIDLKVVRISAEVPKELISERLHEGKVFDFESGTSLTQDVIHDSTVVVAQMGPEPIIKALEEGPDVILAGRACDEALFSALPISRGFDAGLATHMGKILECGALASFPHAMDVMLGTIRKDHFELTPGSAKRACTVASVASHSLYEREDPIVQVGPGGLISLKDTVIEQVSDRTVRVSGTTFTASDTYKVKLEGVRPLGYRTISIAGVRCPLLVGEIEAFVEEGVRRTDQYMMEAAVDANDYTITYHLYGKNAVMGPLEPVKEHLPLEVGVLLDVVATTQDLAHSVCHHLSGSLLHIDWPNQLSNSGNVAFPYSPSETDSGVAYEFSIYHLMEINDPREIFPQSTHEMKFSEVAV